MWIPSFERPGIKMDTDLDADFEKGKGDFSALFASETSPVFELPSKNVPHSSPGPSQPTSTFRSISVSTTRGADGRIEERRTVHNGSGNEESTVTRKMGDQTWSQTTKRRPDGSEELSEETVNLDNKEKENFEKQWSASRLPSPYQETALTPRESALLDIKKDPVLYNLFGSSFSGFPKSSDDEPKSE